MRIKLIKIYKALRTVFSKTSKCSFFHWGGPDWEWDGSFDFGQVENTAVRDSRADSSMFAYESEAGR